MPRQLTKKGSFSQEEISLTTPSSPVSLSRSIDLPAYSGHDAHEKHHNQHGYREKGRDQEFDDEEHGESAALLSEMEGMEEKEDYSKTVSRKRKLVAAGFIFLILSLVAGSAWWSRGPPVRNIETQSLGVLSNGTHDFHPTVLMVSLDGLRYYIISHQTPQFTHYFLFYIRAEYVERNLTNHLHDISVQGLRAEFIRPVFPSLTFPYVLFLR